MMIPPASSSSASRKRKVKGKGKGKSKFKSQGKPAKGAVSKPRAVRRMEMGEGEAQGGETEEGKNIGDSGPRSTHQQGPKDSRRKSKGKATEGKQAAPSTSNDWQEIAAERARSGKAKAASNGKRKHHAESAEATGAAEQGGDEATGAHVYKLDRRSMRAAVRSFS